MCLNRRACYDIPTGRLIVTHGTNGSFGTLDEQEAFARFILRAVACQRALLVPVSKVAPVDTLAV